MEKIDLVVIGSGPAGHFGAIQAAKAGKKVAIIEALDCVGGSATIHGTVPSKALREAALHLTGHSARAFYGMNYQVKKDITIQDLVARTGTIIRNETSVFANQLHRNGIQIVCGRGSFVGPHQLVAESGDGVRILKAHKVLIACGSRPTHPPGLDFDGDQLCGTSDNSVSKASCALA